MGTSISASSVVLGRVNGDVAWGHAAILSASVAAFRNECLGDFNGVLEVFLRR